MVKRSNSEVEFIPRSFEMESRFLLLRPAGQESAISQQLQKKWQRGSSISSWSFNGSTQFRSKWPTQYLNIVPIFDVVVRCIGCIKSLCVMWLCGYVMQSCNPLSDKGQVMQSAQQGSALWWLCIWLSLFCAASAVQNQIEFLLESWDPLLHTVQSGAATRERCFM